MVWRLALIAALLSAAPAAAQPTCEDAGRARRLFEEARDQASARRLARARELYLESQALCPRVPTAFNLASTHLLLGQPTAAIALLEAIESESLGPLDPTQREVVRGLVREAQGEVAHLAIRATGAPTVHVQVGRAPPTQVRAGQVERVAVDPGRHRVRAHADDGRAFETEAEVGAGETREVLVTLPAAQPQGRIVLSADDEDAALEIVGVATGTGRLARALSPDRYQVRGPGREATIDLLAGRTERVHFGASEDLTLWIWLGVGLAVVAAGAITAGILLSQPGYEDDPVWGRVEL